jgi:hypothetical protein
MASGRCLFMNMLMVRPGIVHVHGCWCKCKQVDSSGRCLAAARSTHVGSHACAALSHASGDMQLQLCYMCVCSLAWHTLMLQHGT